MFHAQTRLQTHGIFYRNVGCLDGAAEEDLQNVTAQDFGKEAYVRGRKGWARH